MDLEKRGRGGAISWRRGGPKIDSQNCIY